MDERFPDRMKTARGAAGLSQEKAAKVSGVSRAMISRYENGEMEPKVTPLTLLARAYRVSPTWLLSGEPPMEWEPESRKEDPSADMRRVASWLLRKAAEEGKPLTDDEMPLVDEDEDGEGGEGDVGTPPEG